MKKTAQPALPLGITLQDTDPLYRKGAYPRGLPSYIPTEMKLYRTEAGWMLCTLYISSPGKRNRSPSQDRYYAIGVGDKKIYTVGRGPHVLEEMTVYLSEKNKQRLSTLIELFQEGLSQAGQIRDRISSRRAQGAMRRRDEWYM